MSIRCGYLNKEVLRMAEKHMKSCSTSFAAIKLGQCRWKRQWGATTHLVEWLIFFFQWKYQLWTRMGATRTFLCCWWEWERKLHMRNSLAVSFKVKYILPILPSNAVPRNLSQKNESWCSHKNLYTNIYSSIIIITKNWKPPKR